MRRAGFGFLELPIKPGNVSGKCHFRAGLTFDSTYQEFLAKSLTEKYGDLNVQLDKIINDANSQIENLNQRMQGLMLTTGMHARSDTPQACKSSTTNSNPRI